MAKIDNCCAHDAESILVRQPHWHRSFQPIPCESICDFDMMMGHEIALEIRNAREAGCKIAFIFPVGPMGMYRWAVYPPPFKTR